MHRITLAVISLAAATAAQDFVFPLGYGHASGPPGSSYPAARAKDQNGDGVIAPEEIYAFCTTLPTQASSGDNFMVDGRYVWENGNIVFYFTDSEDGLVVRGEDSNHNGVIDPAEANIFFRFGPRTGTSGHGPDTLGVYRDTAAGQTRVYVATDVPGTVGHGVGIHRLVDSNGDGDALDPGEHSPFVNSSMNLTVPGLNGPVTISRDYWNQVRVLPGGKVIAFAKGLPLTGVLIPNTNPPQYTYTVQPEMNCWYGFTDNNGTAVPEVWFNASALNDLAVHADFDDPRGPTTALFPNWDIQDISTPGVRNNWARFCDVVAGGGPNGEDVYYLGSSYRTNVEGDINLNGESIAGLIYRVVDTDADQVIDQGEISLYFNLSGSTYNNVPPITFDNHNQVTITNIQGRTWGFGTSPSGSVNLLWENGGTNDGVVSMVDANANGVVDQGEAFMPYATPQGTGGYLPPFHPTFGPYLTSLICVGDLEMPGPFGDGFTLVGDACPSTTGEKPVMEAWNGIPQIGNLALEIGCIRGLPNLPAFLMGDLSLRATPLALAGLLGNGCFSYLNNPVPVALTFGDNDGTHRFNTQIPNVTAYVGVNLYYQMALLDPAVSTPVTYVVSNALGMTIQP